MSNLIRYNRPFSSTFDELEKFLSYPSSINNRDVWLPDVYIKDDGSSYSVKSDVPGMDKKDIKINIDRYNNLIIEGERDVNIKKEQKNYLCFERYKGSFFRKIALPSAVDAQNIKAKYRDGVLEINVPKAKENITKQIDIGD